MRSLEAIQGVNELASLLVSKGYPQADAVKLFYSPLDSDKRFVRKLQSEKAMDELVALSEEMGMYDKDYLLAKTAPK